MHLEHNDVEKITQQRPVEDHLGRSNRPPFAGQEIKWVSLFLYSNLLMVGWANPSKQTNAVTAPVIRKTADGPNCAVAISIKP